MTESSKFYALLIGIDRYEPNQYYKDLRGCVRDIDLVDQYVRKTLNVSQEHIWKLTSPLEETNTLSAFRSVQPEIKPTYANIVKAFQEITDTAQSGEQVYIHYSGHGGKASTIYPEIKGEGQDDESIVPMDVGNSENRYLRDVEIATLLKRLTDKGCIVTVIFDSCHSGGATRGDCAIRGNETNQVDTAARNKDSLIANREELINNWQILTNIDPELSGGWLPNSRDYVFLAACRPSEFAYEYAVNGGQRHGALTYWTIDTLSSTTSVLNYKSLYNRVKAMVQSNFPQQLPMLIGDSDRLVFGIESAYLPYTVTVINVDQERQQVTLDAGLAQGLSSGTRFAIYPLNTTDFADKTKQVAIAEITEEVEADRSVAKILTSDEGGIVVRGKIEPGTSAVMVTAPIDLIKKVRLFNRKQEGDQEQDLPTDLVDKQTAALEKVRQALVGNGWLVEVKSGEEAHYQVAVGRNGEYEICIGMPIANLRPPLMINDSQAPQGVIKRLVHLSKYQAVQALDNPASELTDYLEFELCERDRNPFRDRQNIALQPGEISYLRVKNTFSQPLNIAVLDLEPTWEISQIPIQGENSSFFPLQPNQQAYTKLRFKLPENGYNQAKETLKLFATKGLANFQWLILPSLDNGLETKGNLNLQLRSKAEELRTRGEVQTINPLNNLLSAIGADVNNPPQITRAMVDESQTFS
jgi:hypothetical protein